LAFEETMEQLPTTAHCPRCQVVRPVAPSLENGALGLRCQACGSRVDAHAAVEAASEVKPVDAHTIKILCVDDDPLILQMLGDVLRIRGYTVVTAPDGEAGLGAAARERPDLILLDVMMPGIDGFEVCRLLKADADLKAVPIVILTAMNDAQLSARAFEAGAVLALLKTADTKTVFRTIEAALAIGKE
jgi:CheY-like chemotaxis protein